MPNLYLIPTSLGECDFSRILPAYNTGIVTALRYFIVEDVRTARRFLKKSNPAIDIDSLTFYVLNQHTGADVVAIAQRHNFTVVPLVGPSSILLSLMASGFNGQSFAFVGYLPIQPDERSKALKKLESRAYSENQSQIFIETPYRNMKMLDEILRVCQPATRLCIAADITLETEFIKTKTVKEWKIRLPELSKRPCIFILYKS